MNFRTRYYLAVVLAALGALLATWVGGEPGTQWIASIAAGTLIGLGLAFARIAGREEGRRR